MVRLWMAGFAVLTAEAAGKWVKLEADDFTIMSDARERDVRALARDFAAYREAVRRMFARPGVSTPRSVLIVHARRRDLLDYVPEVEGRGNIRRFSYSTTVDGRAVTALALDGDRDEILRITAEFETMWLLDRYGWSLPTWASQGAGTVLSTTAIEKDGAVVVGARSSHFGTWSDSYLLTWSRFFEIGRASPEYRGEERPGIYHAQAWGLMHWLLLQEGDGAARFAALAERLGREDGSQAVPAISGVAVEDLTRAIRDHLRRDRKQRFGFDADAVVARMTLAPLPEAERLALLADVAAHTGKSAESDLYYFKARELAPDSPAVLEAGARWLVRRGEPAAAVESYRQAIAAGSTNANAFLESARWRLDRSGQLGRPGSGVAGAIEPAEQEVRQALALDPGLGEAFALLGRIAYLAPTEPTPELVAELSRRVGPDGWGVQVQFYRALVLRRLGQKAEAEADLLAVQRQPEAHLSLRQSAAQQLADLRLAEVRATVETAVRERDYAAAWTAAREAERRQQESGWGEEETRQLTSLTRWLDEQERRWEQSQFDREWRRVDRMLKDKKYRAALDHALSCEAGGHSERLKATFSKLRAQVQGAVTLPLMKAAAEAGKWAEVAELGRLFLDHQPEDHSSRPEVEALLEKAKAGAGSGATLAI